MAIADRRESEIPLLERVVLADFRLWHILALCSGIVLSLIIMVCCCIRLRIPRTKQEIEADYRRKQITKKFRDKLAQIKNSEMDDMDLQKALGRIQADYVSIHSSNDHLAKDHQHHDFIKFKMDAQNPI